jgi:hypothetical protein
VEWPELAAKRLPPHPVRGMHVFGAERTLKIDLSPVPAKRPFS